MVGLVVLLFAATAAQAQSGASFDIAPFVVAGGGGRSAAISMEADGTIGQSVAGRLAGGAFDIEAGFWTGGAVSLPPTATPTATSATTMAPTGSATPSATATDTTPPLPTPSSTLPPTSTPSSTAPPATSTPTPTSTPPATSTATPAGCAGDCDGDMKVTVDEIIRMVNIALGIAELSTCPAADADGDAEVSVVDIVAAVNNALDGCAGV